MDASTHHVHLIRRIKGESWKVNERRRGRGRGRRRSCYGTITSVTIHSDKSSIIIDHCIAMNTAMVSLWNE